MERNFWVLIFQIFVKEIHLITTDFDVNYVENDARVRYACEAEFKKKKVSTVRNTSNDLIFTIVANDMENACDYLNYIYHVKREDPLYINSIHLEMIKTSKEYGRYERANELINIYETNICDYLGEISYTLIEEDIREYVIL